MDGFLILDKPEGITSAECVYKLRSILGIKKIGHCGTLDPLATGLLPISIGEGTKFSNYLTNKDKLYEVGIKFGLETDTGDITGKIVSKSQKSINFSITSSGFDNNSSNLISIIFLIFFFFHNLINWE